MAVSAQRILSPIVATLTLLAMRRTARRWLRDLHAEHGDRALASAAALPGLSAALDQHMASLRDIVLNTDSAHLAAPVLLAEYGRGLQEEARNLGWVPIPPQHWAAADWISLRLAAVCALALRLNDHTPVTGLPPL